MALIVACTVAMIAGVIKGVVGFAMPTIILSGLSMFLAPDIALAGLIVPTLVTNIFQAMRQGPAAVVSSVKKFRVFLLVGFVALICSAQMVRMLPLPVMFLMIGIPIAGFAAFQLAGYRFRSVRQTRRLDAVVGGFVGMIGGLSGIWGPPTVAYLTALNTPRHDQMRAQGVIYGGGAIALFGAHLHSGVLHGQTLLLSAALVPPALVGMWISSRFLDMIDQKTFGKLTLIFLLIAGANLIRRGLVG